MATFAEGFGGTLDELEDDVRVAVVDVSASWCAPCRRQDPVFERVADAVLEERPDAPVAFLLVDVDENGALARQRRVKSVPTTLILTRESALLLGEAWREARRFKGVTPYPVLAKAVEEALDEVEEG